MAESLTTARPYAFAAFEEAQKLGNLKGWSEMLLSLAETVSHPEIHAVITSPRFLKSQIEDLMESVLGKEANIQQRNFVRLLIENRRLLLLPEILVLFEKLKSDAEKTIDVVVDSAFELSAAQQDRIISSLKARMGRQIRLVCRVDKELLGGVVIRAGDKVIDGSARTRLGELANALA